MRRLVTLLLPILSVLSLIAFFVLPWFAFGSDTSTAWHYLQQAFTEQGNRLYIVIVLIPLAAIMTLSLLTLARMGKAISSDMLMLMNGLALLPFGYYYYDLLTTYNLQQQQKLFNPANHIQVGFWLHVVIVASVFVLMIVSAMQWSEQPEPPTKKIEANPSETEIEQAA